MCFTGIGFLQDFRKASASFATTKKHEAEIAINKLNGVVPNGGNDPLTVKFANNPANQQQKTAIQVPFAISIRNRKAFGLAFLGRRSRLAFAVASRPGGVASNRQPDSIAGGPASGRPTSARPDSCQYRGAI